MKKFASFLLMVSLGLFSFSMIGCGGGDENGEVDTPEIPGATEPSGDTDTDTDTGDDDDDTGDDDDDGN